MPVTALGKKSISVLGGGAISMVLSGLHLCWTEIAAGTVPVIFLAFRYLKQ